MSRGEFLDRIFYGLLGASGVVVALCVGVQLAGIAVGYVSACR